MVAAPAAAAASAAAAAPVPLHLMRPTALNAMRRQTAARLRPFRLIESQSDARRMPSGQKGAV